MMSVGDGAETPAYFLSKALWYQRRLSQGSSWRRRKDRSVSWQVDRDPELGLDCKKKTGVERLAKKKRM
jgi:hypothetical protein